MPPKGSKRTEVVTLTDEPAKKPRLDLEEQIERAAALAAQLRDGVKDGADSNNSTANQIATEELMRIFESMQEKTEDSSQSFEGLVQAQIVTEVNSMLTFLDLKSAKSHPLGVEIDEYLTSKCSDTARYLIKTVQEEMENVTSGDYVAKIKELIKVALRKKFLQGIGDKFDKIITR